MEGIKTIYTIALILGVLLPGLSVLLSGVTSMIDFDFDLDFDGVPISNFLPLKPLCLFMFILVFGGVGLALTSTGNINEKVVLAIAIGGGYLFAVALNVFVLKPLRRNKADALREIALIGEQGKVTVRIRQGSVGEVKFMTESGVISYPAILEEHEKGVIEEGDEVKVVGIDRERNRLIVVEAFNIDKEIKKMEEKTCIF